MILEIIERDSPIAIKSFINENNIQPADIMLLEPFNSGLYVYYRLWYWKAEDVTYDQLMKLARKQLNSQYP